MFLTIKLRTHAKLMCLKYDELVDLTLNNQQRLICHKTQPTTIYIYKLFYSWFVYFYPFIHTDTLASTYIFLIPKDALVPTYIYTHMHCMYKYTQSHLHAYALLHLNMCT